MGAHHTAEEEEDDVEAEHLKITIVAKTEHKLAEERGDLTEEPLLKENPRRFVLFPIQDDEVSSFYPKCVCVCECVLWDYNGTGLLRNQQMSLT